MRIKGLLLKDIYTMKGQLKWFMGIILIFACMPMGSMRSSAIIISAVLPMTALAFDEQSKWGRLAATMPYTKSDLVRSKYILGILLMISASALVLISGLVILIFTKGSITDLFTMIGVGIGAGVIMISIILPLLFRFGVEKGRIAVMIVIFASIALERAIFGMSGYAEIYINPIVGSCIIIGAILVALNISMMISERLYRSER